ncbi:hypothetical protein, partial [Klebsiella pneumoniae]|uniref:hypothetical protein n=1 Tax=Klebsiella pneumoniae TaxID=573 RepID=UPI0028F72035
SQPKVMAANCGRHMVISNLQQQFPVEIEMRPPFSIFRHHDDEIEKRHPDPNLQHTNELI